MHILVLGSSGRTGRLIVEEALSQSHTVTALARDPSSFPVDGSSNPGLTIVKGTPLQQADMDRAFAARRPDAILVALATPLPPKAVLSGAPAEAPRFMANCVANAINSVRSQGKTGDEQRPTRLVIMSAFGTGSSMPNLNAPFRFIFTRTGMAGGTMDHGFVDVETRKAATEMKAANGGRDVFDFVIPRPAMLAEGPTKEVRVFPDDGAGVSWLPKITRTSVAKFMVDAAGPAGNQYVGRSPVIVN